MKDQVDALVRRGVKAASLDSTLDADQARLVKSEVLSGILKILYVAPERCVHSYFVCFSPFVACRCLILVCHRLNNEGFMDMMRRVKISLLAVDESHCISEVSNVLMSNYIC